MLVAEGVSTSKCRMGILESISLLIPNFHRDLIAIVTVPFHTVICFIDTEYISIFHWKCKCFVL